MLLIGGLQNKITHTYTKRGQGGSAWPNTTGKQPLPAIPRNQLAETVAPAFSVGAATTPPVSSEAPSPPSSRGCSETQVSKINP